ncbi:MAG: ATP-dependent RecD-like DNA helicase [Planctomycetes bacterium]|nr:ATP-dependent RecD-like DNA helicase [Planctomycetota bacterium]
MNNHTCKKSQKPFEIEGLFEKITFRSEETGFTIGKLKVKGHNDLVVFTGNLLSVNPGEVLKLKGWWVNHPKYGTQFKVNSYVSVIPATSKGIEKYLSSHLIKGIGPVMARKIVARFGVKTLDIIEQSIEMLQDVDGIGLKRIKLIERAWIEQKEIKEVMLFLQGHGVSVTYATKVFKQYGHESIRIVKENPYRLATDIFGIGFVTADKIAKDMGISNDSQIRVEAGIIYVLNQLSGKGHVYYPYELLIVECKKILNTERETIVMAFGTIAFDEKIVIEDINTDGEISVNNKAVYLSKFYVTEAGIARNVGKFLSRENSLCRLDAEGVLDWVQKRSNIILAPNQKIAIRKSMSEKMLVITGGPGTGKTTTIDSIIKIYQRSGQKVFLAAPTGRAAKRMSEVTGCEAKTMHRLLGFTQWGGGFQRNERNPLEAGLIVIDEVSMVETILMYHFMKAVPLDSTLILIGDVSQLPSVGAGNILKDIIDSGIVSTVNLTDIFRQSRQSRIIVNAHSINNGTMPSLESDRSRTQDFYFIEIEDPVKIVEKISFLCKERIPHRFKFDSVKDIQVLTPMNKGILGTHNLNTQLQEVLNPSPGELRIAGKLFKKNDKVMQIVNNYDKDVFNGDIGIIATIDSEDHEVTIDFEGKLVIYDYKDLDEIVLAYAISVHKAQGCEYPVVVMPVHSQHNILLERNLLYTGITRGKKLVVLLGTKKALSAAINNNSPQKRYTYLRNRLILLSQ